MILSMDIYNSYRLGWWLVGLYIYFAVAMSITVWIVNNMFYSMILALVFYPAGIFFEDFSLGILALSYLINALLVFAFGSVVGYFLERRKFYWVKIEVFLRWFVTIVISLFLGIGLLLFFSEMPYTTYVIFGNEREVERVEQCYDLFEQEYAMNDYVLELESCSYKKDTDSKNTNGACGCIYEDKREYAHILPTVIMLIIPLIGLWGFRFWRKR